MGARFTFTFTFLVLSSNVCGCTSSDDGASTTDNDIRAGKVPDSIYSDVHGEAACRIVKQGDPDVEGGTEECEGTGAYRLRIWSGDSRERASILGPEGAVFKIDPALDIVPFGAAWNTVGPKAEWRIRRGEKTFPYALILRHTFYDPDDDRPVPKKQHYLFVTKIVGGNMCLYGIVEASRAAATANRTARDLADEAARAETCPSPVTITTK